MALQPINIRVSDDVENYITAEMDAKIYSQLVSEGIAKDVGNACKVVIGENDIKIQNGLFNIQGYFASIKDFHSISKPVQNDFYVKAKFVKGVSQDEFTIYTDTDSNLTKQDLFNGGTIRELLIAEVRNKNEVTMHNVNLSLAEMRNALQNILEVESQRVKAEKERIEKEIERQRNSTQVISRVEGFIQTLSQTDSNLKKEEQKRVQAESSREEKISTYTQQLEALKQVKNSVDELQRTLNEQVQTATGKIDEMTRLNTLLTESEDKRKLSETEREKKIAEFDKLVKSFDGTKISQEIETFKTDVSNEIGRLTGNLQNAFEEMQEKVNTQVDGLKKDLNSTLDIVEKKFQWLMIQLCSDGATPLEDITKPFESDPTFYSLRKVDGKLCIINGTWNELQEFTKTQQGG